MNLDLSLVFSVLTAAASIAVMVGVYKAHVARLRDDVTELKSELGAALAELRASRDKLGERIGKLEVASAIAERELSRPYHAPPGVPERTK